MARTPVVAAGNAKALLKAAAEAANLSVEELAQLAIDVVGSKLVPKDQPSFTRKQLGLCLWRELQRVTKSHRGVWYKELADEQQIALIVALRDEGYRTEVIARDLCILPAEVKTLYHRYADTVGSQVTMLRLNSIVGMMEMDLETAQIGLKADGDYKAFWQVRKDQIKLLQDLGIIERAAQRIEVNHTFEEQKQAEIQAILELERKQLTRKEEIKAAEFTIQDAIPQIGN